MVATVVVVVLEIVGIAVTIIMGIQESAATEVMVAMEVMVLHRCLLKFPLAALWRKNTVAKAATVATAVVVATELTVTLREATDKTEDKVEMEARVVAQHIILS